MEYMDQLSKARMRNKEIEQLTRQKKTLEEEVKKFIAYETIYKTQIMHCNQDINKLNKTIDEM